MPPRPFSSASVPPRRPAGPRGQAGVSSLLRVGAAASTLPAVTAFSQRPSVLARQRYQPQQLSLFGPPGAFR